MPTGRPAAGTGCVEELHDVGVEFADRSGDRLLAEG